MNTIKIKNPIVLFFLAIVIGLAPSGCRKDLLTPLPQNQLAEEVSFETPDRFLSLLNGIYSQAKTGNLFGSRVLVYNEIRAEEYLNEQGNGVTGLQTWNHTLVESNNEVNNVWNAAYQCINSVNTYLEGAQANSRNLGNDALLNNYLGEARFLRALCYHQLVQLYCRPYADGNGSNLGLPLRIKAERLAQDNDLARSPVSKIYDQILEDLNFAETNLPEKHATALLNVTRAHKNAAIALKTRVYLGMQKYSDALAEANKIVPAAAPFAAPSGVANALAATVKSIYSTPYTTSESILSFPFTTNNLPGTQNALAYYFTQSPAGNGEYSMSKGGIVGDTAAFAVSDERRGLIVVNATSGKPYMNKFPVGPQSTDYAPILRYAEVLLSLAEAEARVNGANQRAVDLLNAVRKRAKASEFTLADFSSADALVSAILKERRIELMGEGFRNFDVTRLLQPFGAKGSVAAVQPAESDYIWPIPSGELATNKLCERNP